MIDGEAQVDSRARSRLWITIGVAVGFLFFYPAFVSGCHFHVEALVVNLVPVLWGFFALLTYRDRKEQIVGWVAFGFAVFSVWMGFESNIVFAF